MEHSIIKLGLDASGLRTAFSSVSSSMTTLRTEGGGVNPGSKRLGKKVNTKQEVDLKDVNILLYPRIEWLVDISSQAL